MNDKQNRRFWQAPIPTPPPPLATGGGVHIPLVWFLIFWLFLFCADHRIIEPPGGKLTSTVVAPVPNRRCVLILIVRQNGSATLGKNESDIWFETKHLWVYRAMLLGMPPTQTSPLRCHSGEAPVSRVKKWGVIFVFFVLIFCRWVCHERA